MVMCMKENGTVYEGEWDIGIPHDAGKYTSKDDDVRVRGGGE